MRTVRLLPAFILLCAACSQRVGPSAPNVEALGGGKPSPKPRPLVQQPMITTFQPSSGKPGDAIKLLGNGFTGATAVAFNNTMATYKVDSDSQITATVPAGALSGGVSVTTPATTISGYEVFSVLSAAPPVITSFMPATGGAGTFVQFVGTGFTGVTGVDFNGLPGEIQISSDTDLLAVAPEGVSSGKLTVTSNAGKVSSTTSFTAMIPPRIISVTPGRAKAGDTITLKGRHFTGVVNAGVGGTAATTSSIVDDSTLTLVVPTGASSAQIYLDGPNGSDYSNYFHLLAPAAPTITNVPPGPIKLGNAFTVDGTNFVDVRGVQVGGVVASFYTMSPTQLSVYPQEGSMGGQVTVDNGAGVVTSTGSVAVTLPPELSELTPHSAKVGDTITFTGKRLSKVNQAMFPTQLMAPVTVVSDTQVTAVVPMGAGPGSVSLTTSDGDNLGVDVDFRVIATVPPTVSAIDPMSGSQHTSVTITGQHLGGVDGCKFGTLRPARPGFISDTQINCNVPVGAVSAPLTLTSAAGDAVTPTFTITRDLPTILSFSPKSAAVGATVTLTGLGFTSVSSVHFGATSALFTKVSDTQIDTIVPYRATSQLISVATPDGSDQTIGAIAVGTQAPTQIGGFRPISGGTGVNINLYGVGMLDLRSVQFTGTTPLRSSSGDDLQAQVTVPAMAMTGPITLFPALSTKVTSSDSFIVLPSPMVTSVTPPNGKPGDLITVHGANLSNLDSVNINGGSSPALVVDDTTLTFHVPPLARTGRLSFSSPSGSTTWPSDFTIVGALLPTLTHVSPESGGPRSYVFLTGSGFNGTTAVRFNGQDATSFLIETDSRIFARLPPVPTTGPITVINAAGTATSATPYVAEATPQLTAFTPMSAKAGDTVHITGSSLSDIYSIAFFGGTFITPSIVSDTELTVVVPEGALSGPVSAQLLYGVLVKSTASLDLAGAIAPKATDFAPASGGPGSYVTIAGTGLTGLTSVAFNGQVGRIKTVNSPSRLQVVVPDNASSGPITLTNAAGIGMTIASYAVGSRVAPLVTAMEPAGGPPGTMITLTGEHLSDAYVLFGDVDYASPIDPSETKTHVLVPRYAATGPILVANQDGETLTMPFFVGTAPVATSLQPTSGPTGTTVVISGSALTGATHVTFNGAEATFTVDHDGQITTQVPSGATTGAVTVTNPIGSASPGSFTITGIDGGGDKGGCACELARPASHTGWPAAAALGLLFTALFARRRRRS